MTNITLQKIQKIVYDELYTFLVNNNLITKHQSGFRPGDSTLHQVLSNTTMIFESFKEYNETRAVFLVFKLQCNGRSGPLLDFFNSYLRNRQQSVVLNGTETDWKSIEAEVPQGSVLGPFFGVHQ